MSATVQGDVTFGMTAESGLFVANVDYDITVEEKWVSDEESSDVAGSLFNAQATWSMQGVVKTGEALASSVLGTAIVLANTVDFTDFVPGYVSGGFNYLKNVKPSFKKDDFEAYDMSGGFKPYVTPA